jgi:hypothetical protein
MFVRFVVALFDAPVPARAARTALRQAGFTPEDVTIVPSPDSADRPSSAPPATSLAHRAAALRQHLEESGVPGRHAGLYAQGVLRGGFVVIVCCPTALAPLAAGCLDALAAEDIEVQAERWPGGPLSRADHGLS